MCFAAPDTLSINPIFSLEKVRPPRLGGTAYPAFYVDIMALAAGTFVTIMSLIACVLASANLFIHNKVLTPAMLVVFWHGLRITKKSPVDRIVASVLTNFERKERMDYDSSNSASARAFWGFAAMLVRMTSLRDAGGEASLFNLAR